jgi:hypothetical protein
VYADLPVGTIVAVGPHTLVVDKQHKNLEGLEVVGRSMQSGYASGGSEHTSRASWEISSTRVRQAQITRVIR